MTIRATENAINVMNVKGISQSDVLMDKKNYLMEDNPLERMYYVTLAISKNGDVDVYELHEDYKGDLFEVIYDAGEWKKK